jgi:hypothetical protein
MKFNELAVNDKFKFNNVVYIKIPEEKANCCKVRANCQNVYTKEKTKLNPLDEVEKLQ